MSSKYQIRLAILRDLQEIVNIYNQAIKAGFKTGHTEPKIPQDMLAWFLEHNHSKNPVYVALDDNSVVGWCSLSPYRPGRPALKQTAEISIFIDFDHLQKGIGSQLIQYAITDSQKTGIKVLIAIILEGNESSLIAFKRNRFEQWGFLPGVANFNGVEVGHYFYGFRIDS